MRINLIFSISLYVKSESVKLSKSSNFVKQQNFKITFTKRQECTKLKDGCLVVQNFWSSHLLYTKSEIKSKKN